MICLVKYIVLRDLSWYLEKIMVIVKVLIRIVEILRMKMKFCRIMFFLKRDGDDDEVILIFGEEMFLFVNILLVLGCLLLIFDKGFDGIVVKVIFV